MARKKKKVKGLIRGLVTMIASSLRTETQVVPQESCPWGSPRRSRLSDLEMDDDDDDEAMAAAEDSSQFFQEMERNIHRNMELGLLASDVPSERQPRSRAESTDSQSHGGQRARFTLDDTFVDDVVKRELHPTPLRQTRASSARLPTKAEEEEKEDKDHHQRQKKRTSSVVGAAAAAPDRNDDSLKKKNNDDDHHRDDDGLSAMAPLSGAVVVDEEAPKTTETSKTTTTSAAALALVGGDDAAGGSTQTKKAKHSSLALTPPRPRLLGLVHSNSTGSLHIDSTLSDPDFKATIECVCRALRAFLTRPAPKHAPAAPKNRWPARTFDDRNPSASEEAGVPPTLKELVRFMRTVYRRGEMHVECLVTAFIFVERLLKSYRGALALRPTNWRPVVFSTMILASKICDDESPVNADWCYVCSSFTVKRINELELALLAAFQFKPTVSASQYAKSYFHFRSMAARLGLIKGDTVKPLDVAIAKRIAEASKKAVPLNAHRSSSPDMQQTPTAPSLHNRRHSFLGFATPLFRRRPAAAIEQLVDMSPASPTTPRLYDDDTTTMDSSAPRTTIFSGGPTKGRAFFASNPELPAKSWRPTPTPSLLSRESIGEDSSFLPS